MQKRITWCITRFQCCFASWILANSDELHFGSDDSTASVMKLRNTCAALRAQDRTAHHRKVFEPADIFHARTFGCVKREIAIINRLRFTTFILLDVTTPNDPLTSDR